VDDDEAFCELAARHLERADGSLSVETETDPTRVLDRLADGSFDAVVSDYEMPALDGIALLRAVRERHGDLPFLLFTGTGDESVASEAIAAGVTDYLRKEFGTEQYALLANRARKAVNAARQRRRTGELERVNRLIRRVNRRIAGADTVTEIERTVCETVATADSYRFAWIGGLDHETGAIVARAAGGDAADYLDVVDIRADDTPEGRGPAGRAIRTGEPQVAQEIPEDPSFEPWHGAAARYEFRSVIVLPVRGSESDHGLLTIYADRRDAFDGTERAILMELAETLAGALDGAEARRRLKEREHELERYESIVEASGDPVYVIDVEGRFTYVTDRIVEMTGYPKDELLGEHVSKVLPAEDVRCGEELIESLLVTGRDRGTYEMTVRTADGGRITCENHVSLLPSEDGFGGTVGVVRDITERKARERELERQNERLEEFASVVSHDLRNPINVVRGSLELAERREDLGELDRAHRGLDRMNTLVEDLLALAHEGERVTEFGDVDLGVVAERAWDVVATGDAALRVETDRTVRAAESRLQQLLENLFRNAVEHGSTSPASPPRRDAVEHGSTSPASPPRRNVEHGSDPALPRTTADGGADDSGGHGAGDGEGTPADTPVTVRIGDLPDEPGFYVEDDGPGIPPEKRDRVFERGYTTGQGGTGFGLRIVAECAEAHGWSVAATAGSDDGARFEFTGVATAEE
jgi:PAS domain S-box-containing protein